MPARSLPAEQNALKTFTKTRGRVPVSGSPTYAADMTALHKIAYPTLNDLPDEFRAAEAASYSAAGMNQPGQQPSQIPNLSSDPYTASLQTDKASAQTEMDHQKGVSDQFSNIGNSALRILQDAIKAKAAPRDFAEAPIGESEIFKQAGVGGFGALSQSLAARGNEIDTNRATFQNLVSQMAGTYKDATTKAASNYSDAVDRYKLAAGLLDKAMSDVRDNEQQIKVLNLQSDLQKELENLRSRNNITEKTTPSFSDQLSADERGYDIRGGRLVEKDPTDVDANDLADAIRAHESGGNYNASGGSGEVGAFQFMPDTWKTVSKQYAESTGLNQSILQNQASEDKVARWKIKQLLLAGNTPREVAMIWNTSLGGAEKPFSRKGVNGWGIAYNSEGYADSVLGQLRKTTGTSAGRKAIATAQAIFDGTSNLTLKDVEVKDRDAVDQELTKLKRAAISSGDTIGMMRASAGGDKLDAESIKSIEKVGSALNGIADLKKTVKDEGTGPIMGIIRSNNPYDAKARLIDAQLRSIVPNLARGVYGEVGVLTDQDINNYMKTLPTLKNEEEVTNALIAMTTKAALNSLELKMQVNAGAGRDVSGLVSVYDGFKKKAEGITAPYQPKAATDADRSFIQSLNLPK